MGGCGPLGQSPRLPKDFNGILQIKCDCSVTHHRKHMLGCNCLANAPGG